MFKEKNAYCSYCGHIFGQEEWPKQCLDCKNVSYVNPTPVVVVLLPVWNGPRLGQLIQQRNIEPEKGEWALCSGYINLGETWQEAAVREIKEEIGYNLNISNLHLMDVVNSKNGNLLIFAEYNTPIDLADIHFVPNEEVSRIKVIYEPVELAFPTHTQMLKRHFSLSY